MRRFVFAHLLAYWLVACSREKPSPAPEANLPATSTTATRAVVSLPPPTAELGKPAPDFTIRDYDGKVYRLADYRGKIVVLEWFNPYCVYVHTSHTKGSLGGLAKRLAEKGIVWLAINSAGQGKQGFGIPAIAEGRKMFGLENPILPDETGEVGKLYGARRTPHMFVIDAQGILVYQGAIDNSRSGAADSAADGKLRNHVEAAVEDLLAGRPVQVSDTKPAGCGVKYDL